jgi:hypothetical protein
MDGLESVAHVRKGARDDDAHRVVDERLADLLIDETGDDPFAVVRSGHGFDCGGEEVVRRR